MAIVSAAYDEMISAAAEKYLPEWDWRWLKAQLLTESMLDPEAISAVGARGIAQFMPGTWAQMVRELKFPPTATAFEPVYAIPAAAYYMASRRRIWWAQPRTEDDRRRLAQASYNAGSGRIIAAQRKANNANDYATIIAALPGITGAINAAQTIGYVERIERWHAQLVESNT